MGEGIFNDDFFPTPSEVAAEMLDPLDLRGRIVLEPSAGSGNLVREALERGAEEVQWIEREPQLRSILGAIKGATPIGPSSGDFLQLEDWRVSHIDLIVMNPPFSADETHILHAWAIAPPGCEIVSLCNYSTVNHQYRRPTRKQRELAELIETYGSHESLGEAFANAERKTDVTVSLVRLRKPGIRPGGDEFDGFYLGPDELEAAGQGLIPFRKSREIVQRYVQACQIYDRQAQVATELNEATEMFKAHFPVKFDYVLTLSQRGAEVSRNRFRKDLQKSAWAHVFKLFLNDGMATSQLQKDINTFVEKQSKIPFTERNIYRMLQIVAGTQEQRIDRAIEEAIDALTRHTKENRFNVEGWAHNSAYMISKKFIQYCTGHRGKYDTTAYVGGRSKVTDLIKALCYITGKTYTHDMDRPLYGGERHLYVPYGEVFDWDFFTGRVYKKGTIHLTFKNLNDWKEINQRYARIKGQVLPSDTSFYRK